MNIEDGNNLVAVGSIEEYRVVDGPELRNSGKQPTSPWSYPARGFAAWGSKDRTQVVLPYVPTVYKFTEGLKNIWQELNVAATTPLPPIWVEDPLLGQKDALDHIILADLDDFASQLHFKDPRFQVIPHAHTPELSSWVGLLNHSGWMADVAMPPKPYDYPNIFDRSGFSIFATKYILPIPYSVVATGQEQMLQAYQQVAEVSGINLVWAKLAASGGGYGVVPVRNEYSAKELYERFSLLNILTLYGQEIPWEMQAHVDRIDGIYSWQYHGSRIITPGRFCTQFMDSDDPSSWIGNGYFSDTDPIRSIVEDLQTKTMTALEREIGKNHTYTGGFDFAITKDEKNNPSAVILEHNGARMSDAVLQSEAAKTLGIGKNGDPFMVIKLGKPHVDIGEVWDYLKLEHLAYDPDTQQGIVPFTWLNDEAVGYATAIMTAPNTSQLTRLQNIAVNAMRKEGII